VGTVCHARRAQRHCRQSASTRQRKTPLGSPTTRSLPAQPQLAAGGCCCCRCCCHCCGRDLRRESCKRSSVHMRGEEHVQVGGGEEHVQVGGGEEHVQVGGDRGHGLGVEENGNNVCNSTVSCLKDGGCIPCMHAQVMRTDAGRCVSSSRAKTVIAYRRDDSCLLAATLAPTRHSPMALCYEQLACRQELRVTSFAICHPLVVVSCCSLASAATQTRTVQPQAQLTIALLCAVSVRTSDT
jgi:hypothetical protein